jgi:hypothetical protein
MRQTAVEWLESELKNSNGLPYNHFEEIIEQAKEMEKEQIFKAKNISAKEAYEAGQSSMYCGCYEIDGCTNYEEWLYKKFKSE